MHLNTQQSGLRLTLARAGARARASAGASATASTRASARASKSEEDHRVEVGPRGLMGMPALVPVKDIDTKTTVSSTSIYILSLDNGLLSLTMVNSRSINMGVSVDLFLRRVEGGRQGS